MDSSSKCICWSCMQKGGLIIKPPSDLINNKSHISLNQTTEHSNGTTVTKASFVQHKIPKAQNTSQFKEFIDNTHFSIGGVYFVIKCLY